jgi:large subunit ribosomal protein L1
MTKRGKKYVEAVKELDRARLYSPQEAIELAKKMAHAKYDETVELHLKMGLDPRNATQQVRGVTLLPHGLGKPVRVLDFDTAVATPDMMGKVGKLGKVLGRRGLMPNPKSGTVVAANDLPRVIEDSRKGRLEFKLDRTAIIHVPLGKASFEDQKLLDNLTAVIDAVMKAKPAGAKGQYVKTASIATTIGPGVKLDLKPLVSTGAS